MFPIYFFVLLLLLLFLNLTAPRSLVLKKIPEFIKRPSIKNAYKVSLYDVGLIDTDCLQLFFVCVLLLKGAILF